METGLDWTVKPRSSSVPSVYRVLRVLRLCVCVCSFGVPDGKDNTAHADQNTPGRSSQVEALGLQITACQWSCFSADAIRRPINQRRRATVQAVAGTWS